MEIQSATNEDSPAAIGMSKKQQMGMGQNQDLSFPTIQFWMEPILGPMQGFFPHGA